jgi:hypothetical protein
MSSPRPAVLALPVLLVAVAGLGLAGPAAAAKRCTAAPHAKAHRCKAAKAVPVTTVSVDLLPGSQATVEVPALPLPGGQTIIGTGVTEVVPLSGKLGGAVVGSVKLGKDIPVSLNSANIVPGAVNILSDPACGGAPTLRIDPASIVTIDPAHPTKAILGFKSATATATAYVKLRLAFDSRMSLACDAPLTPTGYSETPFAVKVSGKVGPKGLLSLPLASDPTPVTIGVCLTPGAPDKPCTDAPAGYPVKIAVQLQVAITLKSGK